VSYDPTEQADSVLTNAYYVSRVLSAANGRPLKPDEARAISLLVERVIALDGWLRGGNDLPRQWANAQPPQEMK
jgi:hypothetical protein